MEGRAQTPFRVSGWFNMREGIAIVWTLLSCPPRRRLDGWALAVMATNNTTQAPAQPKLATS